MTRDGKLPGILLYAAHADDELLGASRLLCDGKVGQVVYPEAVSTERRLEASALAHALCYGVQFTDATPAQIVEASRIFVPAITDRHTEHQAARLRGIRDAVAHGRILDLWEYSIEKFDTFAAPLSEDHLTQKRDLWARFYPSQVPWITDPKYLLFEGWRPVGGPLLTVTASCEGFHYWSDAWKEVSYLKDPHRHVFQARVTLGPVSHFDRDLEFHVLQHELLLELRKIAGTREAPVPSSCEHMARVLALRLAAHHGVRVKCSVWEDGENGAEVEI